VVLVILLCPCSLLLFAHGVRPVQVSEPGPAAKLVSGVGLTFIQEGANAPISVACINKGGSAEQQGKVQVGDEIDSVENVSVAGKSVPELKQLMRGEIGSYVNMKLRRGKQDGSLMHYDVSLMRGQAEAFLVREKQRLQALLENDRKQLNHAQVENEALYGAMQRMQMQSAKDQQEIERLTTDLVQGKGRVAEIQNMIALLIKEREELLRGAGDDGSSVREELQKLTDLLTEAETRLVAAKKSLEDDQRATWELEDKLKRETSAREACQQRIKQMEVELPARMEQERIYRQNQEQLKLKLEQSRDRFKQDWERAKKKMEEEQNLVQKAEAEEVEAENKLAAASNKNQEIQVQVKDTEKMLRATEGLVIFLFLSLVFPGRSVRPRPQASSELTNKRLVEARVTPKNKFNLAMKHEQLATKYLPCFWC
jgi:hypothetical protein